MCKDTYLSWLAAVWECVPGGTRRWWAAWLRRCNQTAAALLCQWLPGDAAQPALDTCVCVNEWMHECMWECMYVCMYVLEYISVSACIYSHTKTQTDRRTDVNTHWAIRGCWVLLLLCLHIYTHIYTQGHRQTGIHTHLGRLMQVKLLLLLPLRCKQVEDGKIDITVVYI